MKPMWCASLLLCGTFSLAVSAEIQPREHGIREESRRLVAEFEAKLPHIPAWQRARGVDASVGPPRRSLETRAAAIEQTKRVLDQHNVLHKQGNASFFLSWNALSDLTDEEYRAFLKTRNGPRDLRDAHAKRAMHSWFTQLEPPHNKFKDTHLKKPKKKSVEISFEDASTLDGSASTAKTNDVSSLPKNWSWIEIDNGKYLTPIKNQGTCGSCWAFSAVSVIESRYAIDNNVTATPLSVEQVLSCSAPLDHIRSKFKNMVASSKGCEGGMPFLAFEYMSRVAPNGIACATEYPYVMATKVSETQCQTVSTSQVAVGWKKNETDYEIIEPQNEAALMRAVIKGPVSSNIDALGDGFRHYGGGIYDASDCASDGVEVNHAVVIVGYGETDAGQKYWIVRNTWGTMWGENGYIRIVRDAASDAQPFGPCNLYLYSSYPVKLTKGSANADGMCPVPAQAFELLGWAKLMGYDGTQWAMLLSVSLLCLSVGVAFYLYTERIYQRRDAEGKTTYENNYDRWVLPTKEQITSMLARRRPQGESV